MDKEQQIEEMAVLGCVRNPQAHTAEECSKCDFKQGMCDAYRHAEALYNAGYRKIPENAVVLTKEEYEDLKVAADNYDPFWFCSFGGCEGARKGCKDDCEMSIVVHERKKTVKEILQEWADDNSSMGLDNTFVKNIAEKYGVEVEE